MDTQQQEVKSANRRLTKRLLIVVVVMFGFGYALVPLYDVFCEIAGLNGKTGTLSAEDAANLVVDKNRSILVEFVANVNPDLPWDFEPVMKKMEIHPGELGTVNYIATNKADKDIVGQAVPSVAPGVAGVYFSKTECFCFTQQLLKAGETKEMPVRFIIDPKLPENISTVTLSYTFFESKKSL